MRKNILFGVLALTAVLTGCNSDEQKAGQLFQRAEIAYATGDYNLVKLQIDSIRTLYPKAFEVRKAGIALMQRAELEEQKKTLAYLDSMMAVKQASLDSIKGNFVLEKIRLIRKRVIIFILLRSLNGISGVRSCADK